MKGKNKKIKKQILGLACVVCVITLGLMFKNGPAHAAFREPGKGFPDGASSPPLDEGDGEQYKNGTLKIGTEGEYTSLMPDSIVIGGGGADPGVLKVQNGRLVIAAQGGVNSPAGLCMGASDCITSWSEISGSQWEDVDLGISYMGGKVGIKTNQPSSALSLKGKLEVVDKNVPGSKMYVGYDSAGGYAFVKAEDGVESKPILFNGGNGTGVVSVGTLEFPQSIPELKLNVGGTINATDYYINGQPFDASIKFPLNLPPGAFGFVMNENASQPTKSWTGFNLSNSPNNSKRILIGVDPGQSHNVFDVEDAQNWEHKMELRADGSAFFKGRVGIGAGSQSLQEALQIGDRWMFHNGGQKIIGYNFYYGGNPNADRRAKNDEASNIAFNSQGIQMRFGGNGPADSEIKWKPGLAIKDQIKEAYVGFGTFDPQGVLDVRGEGNIDVKRGAQAGTVYIGDGGMVDFNTSGDVSVTGRSGTSTVEEYASDGNFLADPKKHYWTPQFADPNFEFPVDWWPSDMRDKRMPCDNVPLGTRGIQCVNSIYANVSNEPVLYDFYAALVKDPADTDPCDGTHCWYEATVKKFKLTKSPGGNIYAIGGIFSDDPNQNGDSKYHITVVDGGVKTEGNRGIGEPINYFKNEDGAGSGVIVDGTNQAANIPVVKIQKANNSTKALWLTNKDESSYLIVTPQESNVGHSPMSLANDAGIFYSKGFVLGAWNGNGIRISETGNVGINTGDPAEKLHVKGDVRVSREPFYAFSRLLGTNGDTPPPGSIKLTCPNDDDFSKNCPDLHEEYAAEGQLGYDKYCAIGVKPFCVSHRYHMYRYRIIEDKRPISEGGTIYSIQQSNLTLDDIKNAFGANYESKKLECSINLGECPENYYFSPFYRSLSEEWWDFKVRDLWHGIIEYRIWQAHNWAEHPQGEESLYGVVHAEKVKATNVPGFDIWMSGGTDGKGKIKEGNVMAKIDEFGKLKVCADEEDDRGALTDNCERELNGAWQLMKKEGVTEANICSLRTNDDDKDCDGKAFSKNACFSLKREDGWKSVNLDLGCSGADGGYLSVLVDYK